MHAQQLSELLASQSLFADCDKDELADIILRGHYVEFDKDEEIIGQGEEGDTLFIILRGNCRVSMVASNGREIVLDYLETGQVIGEIAFLDGGERTASVHAMNEVATLSLSRAAFQQVVSRHQGLALRLLQAMARRLRQSNDIIEADRAFTAGPRLARYLLRLMMAGAEGGPLKLALSQGELGHFAGMSREQINRQLSAWSEAGVVETKSGRISILDRAMLTEIAEAY